MVIPQLSAKASSAINLGTDLYPTLVNKDARAACKQNSRIQLGNVGVVNIGLSRCIDRKIVRPELDPIAIPEKLRGVLASTIVKVAMRGMKAG